MGHQLGQGKKSKRPKAKVETGISTQRGKRRGWENTDAIANMG